MPLNLTKIYPQLLEIMHLSEGQRKASLRSIFDRDITFNNSFQFKKKQIRPTKQDGIINLDHIFNHLITEDEEVTREDGTKYTKRVFEKDRSERLHWVKPHIDESTKAKIEVFSIVERDTRKRKDVTRTYIYNTDENYVVVLEPQNTNTDYYLLTAYYLNKDYAPKQMKNKMKKKLPEVY